MVLDCKVKGRSSGDMLRLWGTASLRPRPELWSLVCQSERQVQMSHNQYFWPTFITVWYVRQTAQRVLGAEGRRERTLGHPLLPLTPQVLTADVRRKRVGRVGNAQLRCASPTARRATSESL